MVGCIRSRLILNAFNGQEVGLAFEQHQTEDLLTSFCPSVSALHFQDGWKIQQAIIFIILNQKPGF